MRHKQATLSSIFTAYGLPAPEVEYRFAPPRRWRFDYAWPSAKVAVEIEGGIWIRGRHVRGAGYASDIEKYNCATELGWRILRYQPSKVDFNQIARVLSDDKGRIPQVPE